MTGLDVTVVANAGESISAALAGMPGAGAPNRYAVTSCPACRTPPPENAVALGAVIKYGNSACWICRTSSGTTRRIWCARATASARWTSTTLRHGTDLPAALRSCTAVRPPHCDHEQRAMKGGTKGMFEIVRSSPAFEDFWQIHYSEVSRDKHIRGSVHRHRRQRGRSPGYYL
jgi:hypothetical protein